MSELRTMECDVAVIGGGPAGIAAAARAAEHGARTIMLDSGLRPGGQIWRHLDATTLPSRARSWLRRLQRSGARVVQRATVVDADDARALTVVDPHGTTRVVAQRIIIATGARERFLPFPGWTLPNIMGVGGAQAMLKAGLDVRGRRAIVAGSGPLLLPVAAALRKAGAQLVIVAEQATARTLGTFALSLWSQPSKLWLAARYRAEIGTTTYRTGCWVRRADGIDRLQTVTLTNGHREWVEPCDLLCCAFGLVPATEMARLLGCTVEGGSIIVDGMQRTSVEHVLSAGETTGIAGDDAAIAEGEIAGIVASSRLAVAAIPPDLIRHQHQGRRFARRLRDSFRLRPELSQLATADTVVCRCEDVRLRQLDPAWTARQAKLYARVGMGPCQGMTCGPALQHLFGWDAGSVRPPLFAPSLRSWIGDEAGSASAEFDPRS
jgi:D-hydroxyproline dehydrogenase subunit alpha